MIQVQVEQYKVSNDRDLILELVKYLDIIKMHVGPMDPKNISILLNAIQTKDAKKWKEHKWDRVDTNSMKWNENNEPEKFTVR